jgi:glycosyltransferase involved in cell wall biosynthesis
LGTNIIVTIGMCVKDVACTLRNAFESVFSQDFPKHFVELIVVEGRSKDETSSIVDECLKNSNYQSRIFHEDTGLGMARQIVVNNALGKYIIWMDADMILPSDYVRRQVEFMEAHSSVGITGGQYGSHLGFGAAADLENVVYVVGSVYGEKGASKLGYLPGTEGSIFRTEAVRVTGGFDTKMSGAAEDTEITYRIKAKGWEIAKNNVSFTESTRPTWNSLWDQYVWYGRGGHFIFHKNPDSISLWKMTPVVGFLAGVLRSPGAYLLTHKKFVFLLPIHYAFKRLAWSVGFLRADIEGYGHQAKV